MVETVFKTLKAGLVWRTVFKTRIAAETAIGRYINAFYNPTRDIQPWASKAQSSSRACLSSWQHSQPMALHFFRASPALKEHIKTHLPQRQVTISATVEEAVEWLKKLRGAYLTSREYSA